MWGPKSFLKKTFFFAKEGGSCYKIVYFIFLDISVSAIIFRPDIAWWEQSALFDLFEIWVIFRQKRPKGTQHAILTRPKFGQVWSKAMLVLQSMCFDRIRFGVSVESVQPSLSLLGFVHDPVGEGWSLQKIILKSMGVYFLGEHWLGWSNPFQTCIIPHYLS